MDKYYDTIALSYNELYGKEQLNKISIIEKNIKINKNYKLLDVGCGTGISSDFNCDVIGLDPSINLLKLNKKNKILGKAEFLPFKDASFDVVVSITAMHNFDDVEKALNEIKRVGKEKFILSALKKSSKIEKIKESINKTFNVKKEIEEDKDIIFII